MNITVNESLPISLMVESTTRNLLPKIDAIASKLEAKLNFVAMTAGWFGDPEDEIHWHFDINCRSVEQVELNFSNEVEQLADDVIISFDSKANRYNCFMQLTANEIDLSLAKAAVLPVLLDKKITKILNVVAERHQLTPIN